MKLERLFINVQGELAVVGTAFPKDPVIVPFRP